MATITPTGYYILIEMEVVEEISAGGVIMHDSKQLKREQGGHSVGIVRALGHTVYQGFEGVDGRGTKEERAAAWGINIGDKVEFNRYDGKVPNDTDLENFRIIQDAHIIGVISE